MDPKLQQALDRLGAAVRTRAHNQQRRFVGVTVPDRPPTRRVSRTNYDRSQEQVDEAKVLRDRIVPDK